MVAIDESSAIRLAAANGTTPPALVPAGAFSSQAQYAADLEALEQSLAAKGIAYRTFTTTVSLRGAKWSNN